MKPPARDIILFAIVALGGVALMFLAWQKRSPKVGNPAVTAAPRAIPTVRTRTET
jgi:hypothetical protein